MDLFEAASGFAVRHLPRKQLLALRESYHSTRKRLYPLLQRLYGTFGVDDLRTHLDEKVGHDYEILMVHTSVNHMLPMFTGSAIDLMQMLIDFCGPSRTLAMPAFYLGDAQLDDVVESYRRNPVFDVRRTPSQTGIVTELFRRSKGTEQSLHPTHRVAARGPLAADLIKGHESADTACGRGTPFEFMAKHDTCIIGIGKPYEVLSQVHHVEDLLGEEFPVPHRVESVPVVLRDFSKIEHPYELRWRSFEWHRDMWKLRGIMDRQRLREWKFHQVPFFATRARDVTDALVAAARDGISLYVR